MGAVLKEIEQEKELLKFNLKKIIAAQSDEKLSEE